MTKQLHEIYLDKIDILIDELADKVNIANVMMQYEDVKSKLGQLRNALNVEEFVKENHHAQVPKDTHSH